ncbi:phosphoribosylaminoimidazolecarboxamide formyltransferase [uncultured Sharpea sp.]|uniref:phosphoribosylaminoimidazolecarboxamide formyltransferase n=1 Tax=uncultured Sharpea sp. TaxID=1112738 RepID=UPI000E89CF4D|nr:phosphoribosylaminoimidazolecarboxamide formyltransferase [uncultured Sharpea sp.]HAV18561.1 phosphoribosylaminoimidazolecarboxamide formyltransferase [Erysipelotrichaceae bacterium]HBG84708.1 phosphoribosylaminoimidazolecarboxamide formyltransferase [Erysipelotrichaceae bacterium]HCG97964.1 phosphoribosylaminoimidazolecarboxamide formyltransferase [Erysipelotrichaceae bacterium]
MKELELKYGCNPNQKPARVFMEDGDLPFTVLNGKPGYINLLDALNSWQLVKEVKKATGEVCAASFKHVSPAGVAVGTPLSEVERQMYFVKESNEELSPVANAYIKARGSDRMSSYGDFCALSDVCDAVTAKLIKREVSDGIIAPGYTDEALEILKTKKRGNYCVIQIDPNYVPNEIERKQVFGVTFEQGRNNIEITPDLFTDIVSKNKDLPDFAIRDLIISMITLKYTQSNSVCYVKDGQAIGIGAGQQSRIHCTRLAGDKADKWYLRQSPQVLNLQFVDTLKRAERDNAIDVYLSEDWEDVNGDDNWQDTFKVRPKVFTRQAQKEWLKTNKNVVLGSDAFFPFGDNMERAHRSGVVYVGEAGGSVRDDNVIEVADKYNMVLAFTHVRLFHH